MFFLPRKATTTLRVSTWNALHPTAEVGGRPRTDEQGRYGYHTVDPGAFPPSPSVPCLSILTSTIRSLLSSSVNPPQISFLRDPFFLFERDHVRRRCRGW